MIAQSYYRTMMVRSEGVLELLCIGNSKIVATPEFTSVDIMRLLGVDRTFYFYEVRV